MNTNATHSTHVLSSSSSVILMSREVKVPVNDVEFNQFTMKCNAKPDIDRYKHFA